MKYCKTAFKIYLETVTLNSSGNEWLKKGSVHLHLCRETKRDYVYHMIEATFEKKRSWSRLCFDTNLSAFDM